MPDIPASLRDALAERYPLERVLGTGGMATVYLAQDLRHRRPVAVKVLRPEVGVLLGRDRFEREIRRTAALNHPNIIPVYDSGEAAGYLYYVMPVMEGESLKGRLARERQLGLVEALRVVDQVAAALQYAHGRGLVHRDIKPANILLSEGRAIVADFGVALAASEIEESRLTETGLSVGTPAYMSPEQAAGHRELDLRSDQYSLACTVFEMLGGDPPFTGSTPRAIIAKQITDLPPSLRTVRPDLSSGVEAVLRRALAKVPGDRFSSFTEFADELRRAALAPRPTAVRWWRSRAAAAGGLILLAAASVGVGIRQSAASRQVIRSIAVLPPEMLSPDSASQFLVAGVQEGLITELGQLREVRVKPRSAVLSFWDERRSLPKVVEGLAVDGVVELALLPTADSLRLTAKLVRGTSLDVVWAGSYSGPREEILRTLVRVAQTIAKEAGLPARTNGTTRLAATRRVDPEVYELVVRAQSFNYWLQGGPERALPLLNRALLLDPQYAPAYAELAKVYRIQLLLGYVNPAEYRPQAIAAARKAVELDSLDAGNYTALAHVEFSLNWDWAAAERAFDRANELNPSLVGNSLDHAEFLSLTGRFDQALAEIDRVIRNDPLSYNARLDLGWANINARRYPEALRLLRGHDHKPWLQELSWCYVLMDSMTQATVVVDRMLADTTEENDAFYFTTAAMVYAYAGRPRQARAYLDSTFAWGRRAERPVDPFMVAEVYAALKQDDEALRWFQRVFDERWPSMMFMAVEPFVPDRLRIHPRVREMLRAAGLPKWTGQPFRAVPSS